MKETVYTNEILVEALFYLRLVQHRRSITATELAMYQNHILEEAQKQGVQIEINHDCTERLTRLRELVDTIFVNGETVYRISPKTTTKELDDYAYFYREKHKYVIPGMNDPLFLASFNDFNSHSEKECEEFQEVDERHQLEIIYQLYSIEKQKRMLEDTLRRLEFSATKKVNSEQAEEIFEQIPEVSKSEFVSMMMR